MQIKKIMFENIFNIVMDMKRKTKDNIKARINISLFCYHKNMRLVYNGSQVTKPKANFVLDNNAQLLVYQA